MTWSKRFIPAIPLPEGGELVTLTDARRHILELPTAQQTLPAWQTAIEALLLIGEQGGPEMLARIAVVRALYPDFQPEPRRKRAKAYRIIR